MACAISGSLFAQNNLTQTSLPEWQTTPVKLASLEIKDPMRLKRVAAFRDPGATPLDAGPDIVNGREVPHVRGESIVLPRLDPLPVSKSTTIIVGVFETRDAYLSSDHARIISELSIRIEQVLRDQSKQAVVVGQTLPILISGGKLQLPDGRIVSQNVWSGLDRIDLGGRYVFFLLGNSVTQSFFPLRAWGLAADDSVYPCNPGEREDLEQGKIPRDRPSFLAAIQDAIK